MTRSHQCWTREPALAIATVLSIACNGVPPAPSCEQSILRIGDGCGPCGLDEIVCGPEGLTCSGATDCALGDRCSTNDDCDGHGVCYVGRCAPPGMAFIPGGRFRMGSPPSEFGRTELEREHPVEITRHYFMDAREVTQGQWEELMGENPSFFGSCGADCPVDSITWLDTLAFANARSRVEGLAPCYDLSQCTGTPGHNFFCRPPLAFDFDCTGYRLPTEAEWEHAYRALTLTTYYNGSPTDGQTCDQPLLREIAQFCDNCSVSYGETFDCSLGGARPQERTDCGPRAAGSFAANPWGLYDMAGNMSEPVWDTLAEYPDFAVDPTGPSQQDPNLVVLRGSNFCGHMARLRAADRKFTSWLQRVSYHGVRLVRTYRVAREDERVGNDICSNDCGGCGSLVPAVGTPCGPCAADRFECAGRESTMCGGASLECAFGAMCGSDADCPNGHCSQGHCALPDWSYIPAGSWLLGSPPGEVGRSDDERLHDVTLTRPFLMMRYEVTQQEWRALMGNNPSTFPDCGDACPVDAIAWVDALAYANALSRSQGLPECYDLSACTGTPTRDFVCPFELDFGLDCTGYRLPTEAEWEYAYRAGTSSAYHSGEPGAGARCAQPALANIANYCGTCPVSYEGSYDCSPFGGPPGCGVHPVGSREPNRWGLFDLSGNVAEFVWDVYAEYPDFSVDSKGPPASGQPNIARGSNFCGTAASARAAARQTQTRLARLPGRGLRLVRSMPPDGTTGTSCNNGCGGCRSVLPAPGTPCGPCGADTYVCSDIVSSRCSGTTACNTGAACSTDAQCVLGHCSNGRCAPPGFAAAPAGSFLMGSPVTEYLREADETRHTVTLTRGLLVGENEVTQQEWAELMGSNPSLLRSCGPDCPVDRVSWLDALAYCNARSRSQGLPECYDLGSCTGTPGLDFVCPLAIPLDLACTGYRLPTEAEWEYAARAGTTTALHNGEPTAGGACRQSLLDEIAQYCGNCSVSYADPYDCTAVGGSTDCGTQPVASRTPNAWGLFDVSGNVSELVWDAYDAYPIGAVADPTGPARSTQQSTHRGGGFCAGLARARLADRATILPISRREGVGFRVVRSLP